MEAFNIKEEKQSTISTYSIFTGIARTLRLLELCLVLFFLFWILNRLPFALRISADFLRSPLFIFALSNAIIVALLAQSDLRFSSSSAADSEFPVEERLECQDKQSCETCVEDVDSCAVTVTDSGNKVYCRSESLPEIMNGEEKNEKLQRSETEIKVREILYPQDMLSNEEFQRAIEAFIAKQMRFLREESC
ncbi:uncharacterized protein LOC127123648 [Lathyrus oleraceus]|uniref:Uncharacterized protein n=1 Tax=Pisum sativum TaxID=3888 RepID=A0A9D5B9J4_PEA|nr:uncharacterized protein LOC127123648 [Pisum sativum]KAI5438908.1 hypothetical protein KIW84_024579 [Pisum sativum]